MIHVSKVALRALGGAGAAAFGCKYVICASLLSYCQCKHPTA